MIGGQPDTVSRFAEHLARDIAERFVVIDEEDVRRARSHLARDPILATLSGRPSPDKGVAARPAQPSHNCPKAFRRLPL